MNLSKWKQFDFSLGVQEATSWLLKKPNELARGINLRFTEEVGGFDRRFGFTREGDQFSTTPHSPLGGHVAKFSTGSKRFVAVNNAGASATIIRTQDSGTGAWSDLSGISYPVNSVVFFLDYLDEVYISGFDPATGDPITPYNVDKVLNVSATRNILHCPAGYFFAEFLGILHIANVTVGGVRRPDRVYKSSPPLGAIGFVQGAQSDVSATVTLVDNVPTMTSNTAPFGTAAASSINSAATDAFYGFDDQALAAKKWQTIAATATGWLRYDFGSGNSKIITYYSMTPVPSDESSVENRAPKTWTFEGSPDGTTWTVLDTRTNQATWAMGEKRTYTISNTTAYRYYRINVSLNQGGTTLAIADTEFLTSLQATKALMLRTDSVRYIKPSMSLDIYRAGTETKLYDITVASVDKAANTFTFIPQTETIATGDVNTSTEQITTSNAALYPTGTPVKWVTTTGLPAPLVADTTYYSIYVDSTHIKLATTYDNAALGNAIDLTTTGSGTHYMRMSYQVADNDEIWLDGTKGKLNLFWNTDYPNPEATGEFLAVKPGTDSSNVISAIGKSSNRLFIWTKNTGSRYDGQNFIVFNNNVGCISQRSVANLDDDWLIWMDAKGNIRARNENTGQAENISRGIRNRYLRGLTQAQMKATSAGVVDSVYKLYLGAINSEYIRVCYDFDANTWSPERLGYPALIQANDDYSGYLKPYFFSSNGRLYKDETGNLDDDKVIAFEAGTGRDMFGTDQLKKFYGAMIFSENCSGLKFEAAVDDGQMLTIGRIEGNVSWLKFNEAGDNVLKEGVSLDWQVMSANEGDPQKIEGVVIYYSLREDVPSDRRP